jgi:hypothetical protein
VDYRGRERELLSWVIILLFLVAIVGVPVWSGASFLESVGIDTKVSWAVAKWVTVIGLWVLIFAGRARRTRREDAHRKANEAVR